MNFKFTKLKIIIGVVSGLVALIVGTTYNKLMFSCFGGCSWFDLGPSQYTFLPAVLVVVLVYLVWSFISKKNDDLEKLDQ